jgi:hypothetical protein
MIDFKTEWILKCLARKYPGIEADFAEVEREHRRIWMRGNEFYTEYINGRLPFEEMMEITEKLWEVE